MSPNEPKSKPVTRTLPAIDVVVENDAPPSPRANVPFVAPASDFEAFRRGLSRATTEADSNPPSSRPSLPVRVGRGAKDKSPWIVVGIVLAELIQHLLTKL